MIVGGLSTGGSGRQAGGFSLVELLLVVLVIAILAAIAVPLFTDQRARGHEAQAQASLESAAVTMQSWATENGGDYSALDGETADGLVATASGFRPTVGVAVDVKASATAYCVTADHSELDSDWRYSSVAGLLEEGACTSADG